MADKDDANDKKKKKSIIASLDLKNYKAKYTDSYGLGKPNEVDLDNFLIAEPDKNSEPEPEKPIEKPIEKIVEKKTLPSPPPNPKPIIEKPVESKPPVVENKSETIIEKKPEPVIETKVDEDFERRVNAVAEDDFYDEKPVQKAVGTFRSNAVRKIDPIDGPAEIENLSTKKNRKINIREPITVNVRHEVRDRSKFDEEEPMVEVEIKKPARRTESYGIIISAVALVYSVIAKDKPLMFLSVSLLLYLARPIIAAPFGKYSHSIENAIKGFSMALFIGSIIFIFL